MLCELALMAVLHLRTEDGLALYIRSEPPIAYALSQSELRRRAGFMLMDVAKQTQFVPFNRGTVRRAEGGIVHEETSESMALRLKVAWTSEAHRIVAHGELFDLSGQDRAITVRFQIPFEAVGGKWWRDIRSWEAIRTGRRYDNTRLRVDNPVMDEAEAKAVKTRFSRYPFCAITTSHRGLALAVPLDEPCIYRLGYEDDFCFVEFDFGLTPKAKKHPSRAHFSFMLYAIDPEWGFRHAARRYYEFFPRLFEKRVRREGIIYTTGVLRKLPHPEDFHIMADWQFPIYSPKEYNYNTALGCLNLFYSLPGTQFTLRVRRGDWRRATVEYCTKVMEEKIRRARENPGDLHSMLVLAAARSMVRDENGRWIFWPHFPVYAPGGMASPCNPDPELFSDKGYKCPNLAFYHIFVRRTFPRRSITFVRLIERGEREGFRIDGVGVDCMAWRTLAVYNHNEEHFPYADYPLTFHAKKPAIYNGISGVEYIKFVASLMRERGRFVAANLVNHVHHPWYAPYIDIPITEIGAIPQPDSVCNYKRTLYYRKPFCLMYCAHKSSFERLSRDTLLTYFHQSTFYGFYPSFHDAQKRRGEPIEYYWTNPKVYNRDRPLFRKFLPIILEINRAGWEPITYARSSDPRIFVERFGRNPEDGLYFTVWNDSAVPRTFRLTFDADALGLKGRLSIRELVSGRNFTRSVCEGKLVILYQLDGHRTAVFKLERT